MADGETTDLTEWPELLNQVQAQLNTDIESGHIGRRMAKYVIDTILPIMNEACEEENLDFGRAGVLACNLKSQFHCGDAASLVSELADTLRDEEIEIAEALDQLARYLE